MIDIKNIDREAYKRKLAVIAYDHAKATIEMIFNDPESVADNDGRWNEDDLRDAVEEDLFGDARDAAGLPDTEEGIDAFEETLGDLFRDVLFDATRSVLFGAKDEKGRDVYSFEPMWSKDR